MSSEIEYGVTEIGYNIKPLDKVLEDGFNLLHRIDQRISTSRGTWVWQIYKAWAPKVVEIDTNIGDAMTNINISTARGFALDSWGAEKGIFRKESTKATLRIRVTGSAADTGIPAGSVFASELGIEYITIESARLPTIISIRKGSANGVDAIPYPYSNVTSIQWINTSPSRNDIEYVETTDWTFENDTIDWSPGGDEPAEGTIYFIGLYTAEDISTTINTIAANGGTENRVSIGQITINSDAIAGVSSVTNDESSIGGTDIETDSSYRRRIIKSSNVQFGYARISSNTESLEPVRSAKTYQVTGVDVAYPNTDWQESATWTTFETWNFYDAGDVILGQTFKPTGNRISIKEISLYVKKTGSPPPLRMKFYYWITDYSTTVSIKEMSNRVFTVEDVDQDSPDEWQEVKVPCEFGGLDFTKTYLFTIEIDSGSDASNHWSLKYQNSGDEYSNGQMYSDGTLQNSGLADIAFKTRWGGAGYNLVVAINPGYSLLDWEQEIRNKIINFEEKAWSPICIQANIMEATKVYVNITGTVFISSTADWPTVQDSMRLRIADYLNTRLPGENVIFSRIEAEMMAVNGVEKIRNVTIQRNGDTPITNAQENDILVGDLEISELDTGNYGPGVNFTQGVWI